MSRAEILSATLTLEGVGEYDLPQNRFGYGAGELPGTLNIYHSFDYVVDGTVLEGGRWYDMQCPASNLTEEGETFVFTKTIEGYELDYTGAETTTAIFRIVFTKKAAATLRALAGV